jgi:uncharacterized protein
MGTSVVYPTEGGPMADNVDVLKEAYEAYGEGDIDKVLEAFDDDAVWQGSNSEELPGGGEHKGKDGIGEALKAIGGAWDEITVTPDEFYENGDNVVVLGHQDSKGPGGSGTVPIVHVVRFEDGKVVRFQVLTDTLHAAELLGLIKGNPPSEEEESSGSSDSDSDSDSDDEKASSEDSGDDSSDDDDDGDDDEKDDDDS